MTDLLPLFRGAKQPGGRSGPRSTTTAIVPPPKPKTDATLHRTLRTAGEYTIDVPPPAPAFRGNGWDWDSDGLVHSTVSPVGGGSSVGHYLYMPGAPEGGVLGDPNQSGSSTTPDATGKAFMLRKAVDPIMPSQFFLQGPTVTDQSGTPVEAPTKLYTMFKRGAK